MAPAMQPFLCPVLHAERLHEDAVWHAVQALVTAVERRDGRLTLFVSPFWAIVANRPIADRLAELARRGHEIGQHTHYYDWDGTAGPSYRKRTDLADENVRRRLDQDRDYLIAAGFEPRGFVSGAWASPPALAPWLAQHGFDYDCSSRLWGSGDRVRMDDTVTEIPTTHSLRGAVRDLADGRLARHEVGAAAYSLFYAHDYDLVRLGRRHAMQLVVRWPRRGAVCAPVAEVARRTARYPSGGPGGGPGG